MSLVGPRPPLPEEVARYERWQRRRLSMKPGMTCLWQVSGRSGTCYTTRVALDAQYAQRLSLRTDAVILFQTLNAVIRQKGAW